jgi:hypothetical protein
MAAESESRPEALTGEPSARAEHAPSRQPRLLPRIAAEPTLRGLLLLAAGAYLLARRPSARKAAGLALKILIVV